MSMLLVRIVLLTTLGALGGCSASSKKPKSSARLYEGDSPSIRYSDKPESAGGALNPY